MLVWGKCQSMKIADLASFPVVPFTDALNVYLCYESHVQFISYISIFLPLYSIATKKLPYNSIIYDQRFSSKCIYFKNSYVYAAVTNVYSWMHIIAEAVI